MDVKSTPVGGEHSIMQMCRHRALATILSGCLLASTGLFTGADVVRAIEPPTDAVDGLAEFVEPTPAALADVAIDRWPDVWGQSLGDVVTGAEPAETFEQYGEFESPVNIGDQYATRMRTLLTPTADGLYRFWISGDDDVRLFFDPTGDDPAEARRIAYIAGWTDYRQFDRFWSQRSTWFTLEAGQAYYMELIGKEGSGGDHFTVAWEQFGGFDRHVVPGSVLAATHLGSGGWRPATPLGLPGVPAAMIDPQWSYTAAPETLAVTWAAVDGAEWYDVRLEGGGQEIELTVDSANVAFDNLQPESRYLIEVAPGSAAGRRPARSRVLMTTSGPYPTPVAPSPGGDRPTVAYDRWDTGWWTLTSVAEGLAPVSTATLSMGLETPPMLGENHAARIRAVLTPESTGAYTFHLSADDDARLVFNPNGPTADGSGTIAYVAGWTEQYQWDRFHSQSSDVFHLVAGRQYYIEASSVHGLGLDHLEVGWSLDGGPIEVVPAAHLEPTLEGAGGWKQSVVDHGAHPGPVLDVVDAIATGAVRSLDWAAPAVTAVTSPAIWYEVTVVGPDTAESFVVDTPGIELGAPLAVGEYVVTIAAANDAGRGPAVVHIVLVAPVSSVPAATTTTTTTTTMSTTPTSTTTTSTTPTTTTTSTTTTTTTSTTPTTTTTTTTTVPGVDEATRQAADEAEQAAQDAEAAANDAADKADKALKKALKAFDKVAKDAAQVAKDAAQEAARIAHETDQAAKHAEDDADKAAADLRKAKSADRAVAQANADLAAHVADELRRVADAAAISAAAADEAATLADEWARHVTEPCDVGSEYIGECIAPELAGLSASEGRSVLVGTGAPVLYLSDEHIEALERAAATLSELLG